MGSARWHKLGGDLRAMRGRLAVMVLVLAVSLVGFGSVLGARTVLLREIDASYQSSHPADATIELAGDVDRALLTELRARPGIAAAEARDSVLARVWAGPPAGHDGVHDGGGMHGMHGMAGLHGMGGMHGMGMPDEHAHRVSGSSQLVQLFVIDDFAAIRLNTFRRQSGAWPPPPGAMLLERSATGLVGADEGDTVLVKTPHGEPQPIAIAGIVHDTGLAPAWQERKGYGYLSRDTLGALGEPPVLHELRVAFAPAPAARADAEATAAQLATWLGANGHAVSRIRVPPLGKHPHASQMATAQMVLLVFSALLFVLSAILVATLFSAMLARQVREIGVMKALGARTGQIARMYAGAVALIGAAACLVALPLAPHGAGALIGSMSSMMNLAVDDPAIPLWVSATIVAAGIAVPLAICALPIGRACRLTVRAALAQYGARERLRPSMVRLPMAARDALRRPARLALTLALLVAGGVLATSAFNVQRAYRANLDRMPRMWHHDLEIRLSEPAPVALAAQLAALPGVRVAEPWGFSAAAFPRAGVDLVHTYPDQGHGSFPIWGVPASSRLIDLPVVEGRWLVSGDTDAIVVSTGSGRRVGERLTLSLDGAVSIWNIVGVVDSVPAGGGYVTDTAFARAAHIDGKARLLRIAAPADQLRSVRAAIERELTRQGIGVDLVLPFATLRDAMDGHVLLLVRASFFLAGIIVLIGLLGLAATVGIGVIARTREIGMMKAVGATDRRILRLVIGEAVLVGAASWALTVLLTLPVTFAIDGFLTRQGFLSARFVVSPGALAGWLAVVLVGSALAAVAPARRAARLTVREALAES